MVSTLNFKLLISSKHQIQLQKLTNVVVKLQWQETYMAWLKIFTQEDSANVHRKAITLTINESHLDFKYY